MSDDVINKLAGIDLWIVEALQASPHQSHSHYEQTFGWIEKVKPKRAVLTTLGLKLITRPCWLFVRRGLNQALMGLSLTFKL